MRQHDEHDLRSALREEADRHRPDRAAMLNRIAQGRSVPDRRPIDRLLILLRPVAAAVAVALVLVLAVAGVRLGNRGPDVDDTPVAAPSAVPAPATTATTAAPEPSVAPTTTTVPKPPRTSTATSSAPPRSTPSSAAPDTARDGFLASTGQDDPNSNDGWSQGNVVLKTTGTITALDVTVEVAHTAGVVETGRWSNVPTHMLAMTSTRTGKTLTYRFTLQPDFTLAPGEYTFAVQFNHAAGKRDVGGDRYRVEATAGGKDAKVSGGFTPRP